MARDIKYIAIHCTAGSQKQTAEDIVNYHKKVLKWQRPGYHYIIDTFGIVHATHPEHLNSNGVKGFNRWIINIAYIGGVESQSGKLVAVDNRTDAQKKSMLTLLKDLRKRYPSAVIQGHRDFSPDKNGNGIVDPWERIKECPCFDAKIEYKDI